MTTKHKAEVLADEAEYQSKLIYLATEAHVAEQLSQMFKNYAEMLRTIPALKAEIESLKKQLNASSLLNYNKGHEDGRALTTYNKPRVESMEAAIEALKEQIKEKNVCLKILVDRLNDGN